MVTAVLSGLVWHSRRLPGLDAWMLRLLGAHSGERQFRLATELATGLRALTVYSLMLYLTARRFVMSMLSNGRRLLAMGRPPLVDRT